MVKLKWSVFGMDSGCGPTPPVFLFNNLLERLEMPERYGGGLSFNVGSVSHVTVHLLILPPLKLFNISSFVHVAVINCF